MFSVSSNKSGSVNLDKSTLTHQLDPASHDKQYSETELNSDVLQSTVNVWSAMSNDLNRLGNIYYNGKEIVRKLSDLEESAEDAHVASTNEILDELLLHNDKDIEKTMAICHLMQQGTTLDAIQAIGQSKGKPLGTGKFSFANKDSFVAIVDGPKTTKIIQERFYEIRDMDNPEEGITYFKAKVIISGNPDDLKNRKVENLDFKAIYTKEYPTMEAARKADYLGIWAAGLSDRETYIH